MAVERYLARCERDLRPTTVQGYRQLFDHDVLPKWGERPLAAITKADVLELLHDKAASGAVSQANHLRTRLRTFFSWAVAELALAADPTAGVRRPGRETARERVLSDGRDPPVLDGDGGLGGLAKGVAWGALFRLLC